MQKIKLTSFSLTFATVLILTFLFACLFLADHVNAQPIELKFAHQNPPQGYTTVEFLDPWMKKVEEATKGRIKITSYPAQSLASAQETFHAVESGIAEMGWVIMGYHPGRFALTEVMTLPFIPLPSAAKNSIVLQELYENIPEIQNHFSTVKLLFLHTSDPYFLATRRPVRNQSDFRGMKIRVLGAEPSEATRRMGGSPVSLPMPGIYEAGERGVIDGAALPWAAVMTQRLYEVFPYWTDISTWLVTFMVCMNLDTWNRLPADVQSQVMSVSGAYGSEFAGSTAWGPGAREMVESATKGTRHEMTRVILDDGVLEDWKKVAGEPIWEEWVTRVERRNLPGRNVLEETLRLLSKHR